MEKGYRYISLFFAAIASIVFIGFFWSYFSFNPFYNNIPALIHIHAILMTTWFIFLIIQPLLIRKKLMKFHRIIGKASYVLVPFILISMIIVIQIAQKRKQDNIGMYENIFDVSGFAVFYLLAIINKRNVAKHMRYMIITALILFLPALARIYAHYPIIGIIPPLLFSFIIIIGLLIYERFHRKFYKPYTVAFFFFLIFILSYLFVPQSAIWNKTANKIHHHLVSYNY